MYYPSFRIAATGFAASTPPPTYVYVYTRNPRNNTACTNTRYSKLSLNKEILIENSSYSACDVFVLFFTVSGIAG